jgi:hypothetical protein
MIAFGRDPELSHIISYRRSATIFDGGLLISTVKGFTVVCGKKGRKNVKKTIKKGENEKTTKSLSALASCVFAEYRE